MSQADRHARVAAALGAAALLALAGWALAGPRPLAAGPGQQSPCRLAPAKAADPTMLWLGEETTVTLRLAGACPPRAVPLHVALSLDASSSMQSGGKLAAAKAAASRFVERLDLRTGRVGLVAFANEARVLSELTDQAAPVLAAIEALTTGRGTDIAGGLDAARGVLGRGRPGGGAAPVEALVLMSDGRQSTSPVPSGAAELLAAAGRAKAEGILVVTVCFGGDCQAEVMREAASRPDLTFDAPTGDALVAAFERIAGQLAAVALRSLAVLDELPGNMRYVAGSARPAPAAVGTGWLRWDWAVVPASGVTVSYRVQPLAAGRWPTNVRAVADIVDTEGLPGQALFPVPEVLVLAPTATPTASPTPTASARPSATATPTATPPPRATGLPRPAYLPVLLRERCDPRQVSTDVALVLDVSDSMNAPTEAGGLAKREAARRAALAFLAGMRLPYDQVAVIAFSDGAQLLAPLGAGRAEVERALAALPQSAGTRIDAGLLAGRRELTSARRWWEHPAALLLLTDGQPTRSGEAEVLAAAGAARRAGIAIYAIGLGSDVNPGLLRAVAGSAERYVAAPRAADLERIYGELARVLPCPGGRHDWGRPWP